MIQKENGNTIVLYDSIENLPVDRHEDYNLYVLIDANTGSTVEDINARANMVRALLREEKIKEADDEIVNLQLAYTFVIQKTNPKLLSYACLVKSINGKSWPNKLSDDDLEEIKSEIAKTGITIGKIKQALKTIKKKFAIEEELLVPSTGGNIETIISYKRLKKRTQLYCQLIQGKDVQEDIDKLEKQMLSRYKPIKFSGEKGVEANYKIGYVDTKAIISQEMNLDPKEMSALMYLRTVEVLKNRRRQEAARNISKKR